MIDTGTDKEYLRRGAKGRFSESYEVGKSVAVQRRTKAKTKVKSGEGSRLIL